MECVAEEGRMEIYVTDNSDGHVLEKVAKPCLDCPNEGNLGVFVIQSLMNEIELIDSAQGKKTIRMVKYK